MLVELTIMDALFVFIIEAICFGAVYRWMKFSWTWKGLMIAGLLALGLSLISSLIGQGTGSGTGYAERLGWPLQYLFIWRDLDEGVLPRSSFDFFRFIVNAVLYGGLVLPIMGIFSVSKSVAQRFFVIIVVTMVIGGAVIGFSWQNARQEDRSQIENQPQTLIRPESE